MKKTSRFTCLMVALVLSCNAFAADPTLPQLRDELMKMGELDQAVRHRAEQGDFKDWAATDAKNQQRLKQIVEQYGWPSYAMVGQDGAFAAWLLAQHSDSDKPFQNKVLALMEPLVDAGQASGKEFAYLYDRTHYPQRFGTQGTCVNRGEWLPFDIEEIGGLEARRMKAGMPTMAVYVAKLNEVCANFTAVKGGTDTRRTIPVPKP